MTSSPTLPLCPVFGMFNPFERRVVADVVRRVAVRRLPQQVAAIEIDSGDQPVRRLDERQPLHVERRNLRRAWRGWRRSRQILARAIAGVGGAAIAWSPGFAERLPLHAAQVADI